RAAFTAVSRDDKKKHLAEFVLRNGLFNHRDDYRHHLTRHYVMFCEIAPSLRASRYFVDLEQLHKRLTGMTARTFIAMVLSLLSSFQRITKDNVATAPTWVSSKGFFPKKRLRRTAHKFFAAISTTRGRFRRAYRTVSKSGRGAYNFVEMQRHPLLLVSRDRAFCMSRRFLMERMGTGLHHTFLRNPSIAERKRYLEFCGDIFEAYMQQICRRMYQDGRFISPLKYGVGNSKEAADGWIMYPNAAIVLEAKAGRFSLEIYTEGDFSAFENKFHEMILQGARQLDRAIRDFRSGLFEVGGLKAAHVPVFYPILVTQQYIPIETFLSEYIQDAIRSAKFLTDIRIHPLQIIHIEDLEHLEADVPHWTKF